MLGILRQKTGLAITSVVSFNNKAQDGKRPCLKAVTFSGFISYVTHHTSDASKGSCPGMGLDC